MADVFAGAGGGLPLETWFYDMPVCTRWWTTATVATSILVQCRVITPFQLFYSFRAVFLKWQVSVRLSGQLCLPSYALHFALFLFLEESQSKRRARACPRCRGSVESRG
jgi:Derlin-2/3